MKKGTKRILTVCLCMAMAVTSAFMLSGCGKDKQTPDSERVSDAAFTGKQSFIKLKTAHFGSFKLRDGISRRCKHSFYLMIFAFVNYHLNKRSFAVFQHAELSRKALCTVAKGDTVFDHFKF